jgi:hypothetical protein
MTVNENTDWTQYGYDMTHSGYNPSESVIGSANVAGLRLKWSAKVDSGIFAQPLLVRSVDIAGTAHDVLYVTGFFNELAIDPYASDGATSASAIKTFWKTALPSTTISCAGTPFHNGTWETPYINKRTSSMYLVDARPALDAINIRTGKFLYSVSLGTNAHAGVDDAVSYNPSNDRIYLGVALRCGNENASSPIKGELLAYTSTGTKVKTFVTVPTAGYYGGGIWAPGGVAIDSASGTLYTATGNSWPTNTSGGEHLDYAEHLISLTSALDVSSSNYPGVTGNDDDFGDTPAMFTPAGCSPMLALSNKDGYLLFYNRSRIASGPTMRILMANPYPGDFINQPVFDPATQMLYETSSTDAVANSAYKHGLTAFRFASCKPVLAWNVEEGTVAPTGANPPDDAYSSPTVANGVVYFGAGSTDVVFGNSAVSGKLLWQSPILSGAVRLPPTIVNGRLYTGDGSGGIYAFGL